MLTISSPSRSTGLPSILTHDDLTRLGIMIAWITTGIKWLHHQMEVASNAIVLLLIWIVSIPIGGLFYVTLLYLNWRLRRIRNSDSSASLNLNNYGRMYHRYTKLSVVVGKIKSVNNVSLKKVPWLVRIFLAQLLVAVRIILIYHASLEHKFQSLDAPYPTLPKGMRVVTVKELAEGRVRGYKYLV